MAAIAYAGPLKHLKHIAKELRLAKIDKLHGTQSMNYIFNQFRANEVTQEQYCKHKQEMEFLADTYATYLESQRHYKVLKDEYHGKGERSIRQTAKMVGFNMPDEPKVQRPPKNKKKDD